MPPAIAALLTVSFVAILFLREATEKSKASGALWLPVLWLAVTGSRFVSQWMSLGHETIDSGMEGSPVDAIYFSILILAGAAVLARRPVVMSVLLRNNAWLSAFLIYGCLAILWSDFPFVAFKRWIKTLGHPIMALIILTDPDPANALRTVLKRCAYLLFPCSVLFIKYFPEFGRSFDPYTGAPVNRGIGLTKNDLGYLCWVFGLFFFWNVLTRNRIDNPRARRVELVLSVGFLGMIGWLLDKAESATSIVALALGTGTIVLLRSGIVSRRLVGTFFVVILGAGIATELTFGVYAHLIEALGRDPTLTDRTHVWTDAIALQDNPIFGLGFESFWLGTRVEVLWAKWWWRPIQAHNGYIETYLNLGGVGVFLLFGLLVSTFRKITRQLADNFDFACLRLAFLVAILAFNFTEAGFKAVHLVWTMFYIIAIDYPARSQTSERRVSAKAINTASLRGGAGLRPARGRGFW